MAAPLVVRSKADLSVDAHEVTILLHDFTFKAPEGISFAVEGVNKLSVNGIDKQQVGEVAAKIRKLRAPEPYKGKGVRYAGEQIRRKAGKAGK